MMKRETMNVRRRLYGVLLPILAALLIHPVLPRGAEAAGSCGRTVTANVVALDQLFFYNRIGGPIPRE